MVLSAVGTGQGLQLLGEALPQSMWDGLGEWKQVVPLALLSGMLIHSRP